MTILRPYASDIIQYMKRSNKKLLEDSNQLVPDRMMLPTKEPQDHSQRISVDLPVSIYLDKIERDRGKKGGPAGSSKLSPKRKK